METVRLRRHASICLLGTDYASPWDLITEAFKRTMEAAIGGKGRKWKKAKGVEFMAHMMMTVKGLANDSLESFQNRNVRSIEAMVTETIDAGAVLDHLGYRTEDIVTQVLEVEEMDERLALAAKVEKYFVDDEDVNWIFEGWKDGCSPALIREISGMDQRRYDNALKRIQRGMARLFPSKEQS